ncbi:MAG: hypothetical protein ABIP75_00785, partial [Pyrinomonadaceae bacterium]
MSTPNGGILPAVAKFLKSRGKRNGLNRFITALAVVSLLSSVFVARTHVAWAARDTKSTIAQKMMAHRSQPTATRSSESTETQTKPAAKTKVTAASLTTSMTRTLASVATAAKNADKRAVNAKTKRQAPFFAALKKTNTNIKSLLGFAKAKDDKKFFPALERTGKSVNELDTAHRLSGIQNPKIADGVKKLVAAFKTYRSKFGKEALRKNKGGALAPAEAAQAKALEAKYRKALADLQRLKAKSGASKLPAGHAGDTQLNALINQLTSMLAGPAARPAAGNPGAAGGPSSGGGAAASVAGYVAMMLFSEDFTGSWYALSSYESLNNPRGYAAAGYAGMNPSVVGVYSEVQASQSSFSYTSSEYWSYSETTSFESSADYSVQVTDAEIASSSSYMESISVSVSVDAYDITPGDDDMALLDHDGDGTPDSADADDDNDGIPDDKDFDDDGDGVADIAEEDTDHDGTPDAIDDDDDNDGIDDATDKDDDGDGIADDKEVADNDGDGITDDKDPDDDNDGTPDAKDTDDDGDGVPDAIDTDDDNDGIEDGEDADH